MELKRDYHTRRAREELDLAYRAEDREAMERHLRCSSIHMGKLRALILREQYLPSTPRDLEFRPRLVVA